mgnify:CR=1 FL=1
MYRMTGVASWGPVTVTFTLVRSAVVPAPEERADRPPPVLELRGDDAEVRDLHGIVFRDPPQLIPPRQSRRVLAGHPHRHEQLNRRIAQVRRDFLVGPIPAVLPVECLADGSIAHPIELWLRLRRARNGDVGKVSERRLELVAMQQLEIRALYLHG